MIDLATVKALTFDCYGTLIDWERGLKCVLNGWAETVGAGERDDRLLEIFGRHETDIEARFPDLLYSNVMREVLKAMAAEMRVDAPQLWVERLARSVGEWPPFTDSAEALNKLKRRFKLCILSNVDRMSFAGSNAKLMVDFDLIVTAQDVGSYKPDPRNFEALVSRLGEIGIGRHEILHVAQSLYHDHGPASKMGLPSVWIDRRGDQGGFGATLPPEGQPSYDRAFPSMRAFAEWACA